MRNRRAEAVLFGFDFQVNAAIVLMLENISNLHALRLEGNHEDIELKLSDNRYILAQAKAIEKSSTDFTHVRENLKKALVSLSDGSQTIEVDKLILITNSPNPLNDKDSRSIFSGPASHRPFATLPPSSQKIIADYLDNIEHPLDINKFTIQTLPFETDDEAERYKVVLQVINDFISSLKLEPGIGKQLHGIWRNDLFTNGTKQNADICLTKKELVWPLIVITTDIDRIDRDFTDRFDSAQYDEIVYRYRETIDSCCERYEFFTRILFDFKAYKSTKPQKEKVLDFIESSWLNYVSEFSIDGIDSETQEDLTKVVLYNVIRRRYDIERIKRGTNL